MVLYLYMPGRNYPHKKKGEKEAKKDIVHASIELQGV